MPTEMDKLLKQQVDAIHVTVEEIKELLTGNGDPSKGVIVRLDRLEQSEKGRAWRVRTAILVSLTAFASVVAEHLMGKR